SSAGCWPPRWPRSRCGRRSTTSPGTASTTWRWCACPARSSPRPGTGCAPSSACAISISAPMISPPCSWTRPGRGSIRPRWSWRGASTGFSISPAIPRRYGTIWRASRILTGWSALRYSISFPGPTTWSAARCWCAATEGQGFAEGDGSEGIVLLDPPRGLDHRLGVSGLHRPPLPVETPLVLGGQGLPGVEDGDMGGGLRHPEQHPVFDPKLGLLLQARGDGADPQAALGVGELVGEDGVGEQMDTAPQGQPLGGGYPRVDNPHPGAVPG